MWSEVKLCELFGNKFVKRVSSAAIIMRWSKARRDARGT